MPFPLTAGAIADVVISTSVLGIGLGNRRGRIADRFIERVGISSRVNLRMVREPERGD